MIPKIYDVIFPSVEARLNFINAGYKHIAFYKYIHGTCINCDHAKIIIDKTKLLSAIITKLLNVNGILEHQEYLNTE